MSGPSLPKVPSLDDIAKNPVQSVINTAQDVANVAASTGTAGIAAGQAAGQYIINPVANAASTVNTYLGQGQVGNDINGIGTGTGKVLNAAGKNAEKNLQKITQGVAIAAGKGNLNNVDRTVLDIALGVATGGASLAINPTDEAAKTKETAVDRMTREQVTQATNDAVQAAQEDAAAAVKNSTDSVAATISNILRARQRAPGRSNTLLTAKTNRSGSKTLLSTGA